MVIHQLIEVGIGYSEGTGRLKGVDGKLTALFL